MRKNSDHHNFAAKITKAEKIYTRHTGKIKLTFLLGVKEQSDKNWNNKIWRVVVVLKQVVKLGKLINKARISKIGSGAETDKYSAERDKSGAELDELLCQKNVPKLVATANDVPNAVVNNEHDV
jgi:hypothetical protein